MDDYKEFADKILRRGSKRHKIGHCAGAKDSYRNAVRNLLLPSSCSYSTYSSVIRRVNQLLAEKLLEGHVLVFPYQMGSLRLFSRNTHVEAREGSVKDNYSVDWKSTLDYWYSNPEAMKSKVCIKRVRKTKVYISYSKDPYFKNRSLYKFRANRSLARKLGLVAEGKRLTVK